MIEKFLNPKGYRSKEEMLEAIAEAAGQVKLLCGAANNAAYYVMMDALDIVKKHPAYKHKVKKFFTLAKAAWDEYERNLLYSEGLRFFSLQDMTPETRKKYGDITDKEYYEYWQAAGGQMYADTRPLVSSLANKYRLSLQQHDIQHADIVGWAMAAQAALELCCSIWRHTINTMSAQQGVPLATMERVFVPFRLRRISEAWFRAMDAMAPGVKGYELDKVESRNIELGLDQLCEAWSDIKAILKSLSDATEDYEEVFRTKGERKKVQREISEASATQK